MQGAVGCCRHCHHCRHLSEQAGIARLLASLEEFQLLAGVKVSALLTPMAVTLPRPFRADTALYRVCIGRDAEGGFGLGHNGRGRCSRSITVGQRLGVLVTRV